MEKKFSLSEDKLNKLKELLNSKPELNPVLHEAVRKYKKNREIRKGGAK